MKPPAKPPMSVAASPTPLMMAAYSLRENPRSITNGAVIAPDSASVNLNSTTKASTTNAMSRERNSENAPTAASATRAKRVFARMRGLGGRRTVPARSATRVVAMPIEHERGHDHIAGAPGGVRGRAQGLEIRSPRTARRRSRPACRCGRRRHRRPCRPPARSPAGFRPGRRRPRCPASPTRWRPGARRARRSARRRPDRRRRGRRSRRSAKSARATASRGGGRNSRDNTGTSSASISGAHRNFTV